MIYAAVNPELKGVGGIYFKDCKSAYTTAASRYILENCFFFLSVRFD